MDNTAPNELIKSTFVYFTIERYKTPKPTTANGDQKNKIARTKIQDFSKTL